MANRLTMAKIQAILSLHQQNWPNRRIARELDVDRETVTKYVQAASCVPKPAKAPIGSDGIGRPVSEPREGRGPDRQSGGQEGIEPGQPPPLSGVPPGNSKPAKAPIGSDGSKPAKAPIGSEASPRSADWAESAAGVEEDIDALTMATAVEKGGSRSACEPYRQAILEKLEQGLSALKPSTIKCSVWWLKGWLANAAIKICRMAG
jgi:hypothetical protein